MKEGQIAKVGVRVVYEKYNCSIHLYIESYVGVNKERYLTFTT